MTTLDYMLYFLNITEKYNIEKCKSIIIIILFPHIRLYIANHYLLRLADELAIGQIERKLLMKYFLATLNKF